MRTIKTRATVTGIKVLDKSVSLSKRMKDSYTRTKDSTGDTQEQNSASPTDYAIDSVQDKAQSAAQETISRLPNPRQKVGENIERAKGHFHEVKRQFSTERHQIAEQTKNTSIKTHDTATRLRNVADKAGEQVKEAKASVKDAKHSLKQVRQEGRQTLREVRRGVKSSMRAETIRTDRSDAKKPGKHETIRLENPAKRDFITKRTQASADNTQLFKKAPDATVNHAPVRGAASPHKPSNALMRENPIYRNSRPSYMNNRIHPTKSAGSTASNSVDKTAKSIKSAQKSLKNTAKSAVKTARKSVKTAEQTAKQAVKTAQQTARAAQKTAQVTVKTAKVAEKAAHAAAKVAVQTAKAASKAIIAFVKAAIAAVKGLIAIITAGGWVAVLIIIIVSFVAMLAGSSFGIFFSRDTSASGTSVSQAMASINNDFQNGIQSRINTLKSHDFYDDVKVIYEGDIEGDSDMPNNWQDVLTIYAVQTSDGGINALILDDIRLNELCNIFNTMNEVSIRYEVMTEEVLIDSGDSISEEQVSQTKKTLVVYINIKSLTYDQAAPLYAFSEIQSKTADEMMSAQFYSLFAALMGEDITCGVDLTQIISNLPAGEKGSAIVEVALTRLGHPYSQALRGQKNYLDCSYLAWWAYRQVDLDIPSTSVTQAKYCYDNGYNVGRAELQPGDLIFWSKTNCNCGRWHEIHHAGIYIGEGKTIEASGGKGRVVIRDLWGENGGTWRVHSYARLPSRD